MRYLNMFALTMLAGAFAAAPTLAQDAATVKVGSNDKYDQYLTDAEGRSLYLFEADEQGEGDKKAVSNCYDECAAAWPPLIAEGEPKAGDKAKADLLGTIERKDGAQQVTYNGWPLYYFAKDENPGDAKGQDIEGFGGEWYLLTPEGEEVHD